MSKPVDLTSFWKERIETAVKPHYSVYVIHEQGWKRIYDVHTELIHTHIKPSERVLDAGCGYGRLSHLFDHYTGVDFSPDFIEWAKRENPGKEFLVADLKQLPFKDKEFDWAVTVSIKRMIQDNLGAESWDEMEREILRVARNLLVLEYEDPTQYEILTA